MADLPPHPETGEDPGVESEAEPTAGVPGWVKVFGIVVLVLVVVVVIALLAGGDHGPGRHSA